MYKSQAYNFEACQITWECHSCNPRGYYGAGVGVEFLGEGGAFLLLDSGWKHIDDKGKTVREGQAPRRDSDHFLNSIESNPGNPTPTSPPCLFVGTVRFV